MSDRYYNPMHHTVPSKRDRPAQKQHASTARPAWVDDLALPVPRQYLPDPGQVPIAALDPEQALARRRAWYDRGRLPRSLRADRRLPWWVDLAKALLVFLVAIFAIVAVMQSIGAFFVVIMLGLICIRVFWGLVRIF